jgi:hypothetical protein
MFRRGCAGKYRRGHDISALRPWPLTMIVVEMRTAHALPGARAALDLHLL